MNREQIEELISNLEQDSLQIARILTRKREINVLLTERFGAEKLRQRELLPAASFDEISFLAYRVVCQDEVYQTLQNELDAIEDEMTLLTIYLEKGRSMVLLEMVERSADAFPLQLLSTKLADFQ